MGLSSSSLLDRWFKRDIRILMLGYEAAGKTTMLYKLKTGEVVNTIPTIGFNVETLEHKNLRFTFWDVASRLTLNGLCRFYHKNSAAIIYVVDSSDREKIKLAESELSIVLRSDDLKGVVVLLIANKQDLPNAMSPSEVAEEMQMNTRKHEWHVQGTCALSGSGLYDGLDYLHTMLAKKK